MTLAGIPIASRPIAGFKKVYTFNSTGGVLIGGAVRVYGSQTMPSTGGVKIGGLSPVSKLELWQTSGGVKIGGLSPIKATFNLSTSGGTKIGGVAGKRYISENATTAIIYDSYWDDIGVLLSNHQQDTGGYWNATTDWTIVGSAGSSSGSWSFSIVNPLLSGGGVANYSISVTVKMQSGDGEAGVVFRWLNASNYWIATLDMQNQALKLYLVGAGTLTLMAFSLLTLRPNVSYLLEVLADNDNIIAQIGSNSVEVDSSLLASAATVGTAVNNAPNATFAVFETTLPVNNIWSTGGLLIGGDGLPKQTSTIQSTGGVKIGGAAGPFTFVSTGGVRIGGASNVIVAESTSGGVKIGGSGLPSVHRTFSSTGGVIVGGSSNGSTTIYSTGGLLVGGSSPVITNRDSQLGNALTVFLSGATSDRGVQTEPSLSLGGHKSSTEATRVGILQATMIPNVEILSASRTNGLGTGSILVVGTDSVVYASPGGSTGTATPLTIGCPSVIADGSNPSKWVKVERTSTAPLAGFTTVEFVDQFNNVFGLDNAEGSDNMDGSDRYRAVIFSNDSDSACSAISIWVNPLSANVPVLFGLGSSGAGHIIGGADAFSSWNYIGFASISTANGVLKEIVYYSSRTSDVLTVLYRGLLGTSATMGSSTDTVCQIPPIRIALEYCQPFNGGAIQTIISENNTPVGVSWTTATTPATGVSVGVMQPGQQFGVWIHRHLPANMVAAPSFLTSFGIQFTKAGVTYTDSCNGLFRVADNTVVGYELHIGVDEEPDLTTTPTETFSSLPYTTSYTFAAGHTYYMSTNYRERFNLVSQDTNPDVLVLDGSGNPANQPPTAPQSVTVVASSTGAFVITGLYYYAIDPPTLRADSFHVYVSFDGSNPLNATPVLVVGANLGGVLSGSYTTTVQTIGTTCKTVVRTYRTSDTTESTNTTVISDTSVETVFVPSELRGFYRSIAEQTD